MEAHTFDRSSKRQVSQHEFKVSHGYVVRTCLKHQEGQSGLYGDVLSQNKTKMQQKSVTDLCKLLKCICMITGQEAGGTKKIHPAQPPVACGRSW